MGRVRTAGIRIINGKTYETAVLESMMAKQSQVGLVAQPAELPPFKRIGGGSNPSGPTKNILIVKKCNKCGNPMYIHITDAPDPIFTGCEPCVVDLRLEKVNDHEIVIKGRRSSHQVRCASCKTRKHLVSSFKEVENGPVKG